MPGNCRLCGRFGRARRRKLRWQRRAGARRRRYDAGALHTCLLYEDNRVDTVFDGPDRFATDALGVLFGAGGPCSTDPSTDGGHFLERARAYFSDPSAQPAWCE